MQRGFTLLEILLIIAMIIVLAALILPLGLDFYKSQQLQTYTQQILQTLRRAQFKAMAGEADSNFGVYFTNNDYTLFRGDSYAAREVQYDEVFDLPQIITVSGPSEVVFSKSEGKPSWWGNIILSSDSFTQTININEIGRISPE